MSKLDRWIEIYNAIKSFNEPILLSTLYIKLDADGSWSKSWSFAKSFSGLYSDLDRMALQGYVIKYCILDGKGRTRYVFAPGPEAPSPKVHETPGKGVFTRLKALVSSA